MFVRPETPLTSSRKSPVRANWPNGPPTKSCSDQYRKTPEYFPDGIFNSAFSKVKPIGWPLTRISPFVTPAFVFVRAISIWNSSACARHSETAASERNTTMWVLVLGERGTFVLILRCLAGRQELVR